MVDHLAAKQWNISSEAGGEQKQSWKKIEYSNYICWFATNTKANVTPDHSKA